MVKVNFQKGDTVKNNILNHKLFYEFNRGGYVYCIDGKNKQEYRYVLNLNFIPIKSVLTEKYIF